MNNNENINIWDKVAESYCMDTLESEVEITNCMIDILKSLGIKKEASLIEIGSGSGHLSALLAKEGYKVTLLDFSEKALEKSKQFFEKHEVKGEFINGNLLDIATLDGDYDVIWNSGVMEHFDDEKLLEAFVSIRKKVKHYFIFLVPNALSFPYLLYRYKLMKQQNWSYGNEYLRTDYGKFLIKSGFKIVQEKYMGWNFAKEHLVYASSSNEVVNYFEELVKEDLVPEDNAYLKAYIAISEDMNTINGDVKVIDNSENATEYKTRVFDITAELNGLKDIIQDKDLEIKNLSQYNTEKEQFCNYLSLQISELEKQLSLKEQETNNIVNQITDKDLQINTFTNEITNKDLEINELIKNLNMIYTSNSWKLICLYKKIILKTKLIYIIKYFKFIKKYGHKQFIKKIIRTIKNKLDVLFLNKLLKYKHQNQLRRILKKHKNKPIIIFLPGLVDWNIPLFQRPQHIAMNIAKYNILYFFCTGNYVFDNIDGFKNIVDGCYVTNKYELLMENIKEPKIIHLYSTDQIRTYDFVQDVIEKGNIVLYEYVDELHEQISGVEKLPEYMLHKHKEILKNQECLVVATADKLFKEVVNLRNIDKNCALITNGVDFKHFSKNFDIKDAPKELLNIIKKNKPIIGYFGALASWFDYELIEFIAKERQDYEILLIGWNYDNSINKYNFAKYENITVIGPINYMELPKYSFWFNVSIIPFELNTITESTSPIKLFEYMAMGHPIVTTDMPECRKYKSVLIGKNHGDFIVKLDEAIELRKDKEYKELIKKEALENIWEAKAKDISNLINNYINNQRGK